LADKEKKTCRQDRTKHVITITYENYIISYAIQMSEQICGDPIIVNVDTNNAFGIVENALQYR